LGHFLSQLVHLNTPIHIINTFEYKLSILLDIPYLTTYSAPTKISPEARLNLISAIIHQQNIIGWDLFLTGFHSSLWYNVFHHLSLDPSPQDQWDKRLIAQSGELLKNIWHDRNKVLRLSSREEAKSMLRQRVQQCVTELYRNPTKLHRRYQKIRSMPLHQRLNFSKLTCNDGLPVYNINNKSLSSVLWRKFFQGTNHIVLFL
jgi:hypothetical protein